MKKFLSGITAAAVAFGAALCLTTAASAAEDNGYALSASFDKAEAAKGGNFTMTLTLDENPGLVSLRFRVKYDPNVVTIENNSDITALEDFGYSSSFEEPSVDNINGKVMLMWVCGTAKNNSTATGDIASVKFTVLPDAAAGSAGISIEPLDIFFVDEDKNTVDPAEKYGTDITGYFKIPSAADFDKLIQIVHEHTWDSGTETTAPSCTEKGEKTFTCAECGATRTEEIEALGHDWDKGTVTALPTCTEKGVKTFVCARCNETKTEDVPALGHDWSEWTVTKEATSDEEGERIRECNVCGEQETETIAKLPPEITTTAYEGGHFVVPETSVAETTATAESETASEAAVTEAVTAPEVTAAVTDAPADTAVSDTYDTAASETSSAPVNTENAGNVGNSADGDRDKQNSPTGVVLAIVPAAAAGIGVLIFKKRK